MIRYSRGRKKYDAYPIVKTAADFDAFERAVLNDRAPRKGLQYIAAPFKVNGHGRPHRCKADVEPRKFLPLDLDKIRDVEAYNALRMRLAAYRGFGYTTASHAPDAPRCRVVLELDREVDRIEGMRIGAALELSIKKDFGETISFDTSVYRGEQPCYGPVFESEAFHLTGDPLNVDLWLESAPPIEPERTGSAAIDPDDDPVVVELKERGLYLRNLGSGQHAIRCPWEKEHTSEDNDQSTATCYFQPHHAGYKTPGFKCLHDHCKNRAGDDLLKALGVDWRDVRDAYGKPQKEVAPVGGSTSEAGQPAPRPRVVWLDDAAVDFGSNDLIKHVIPAGASVLIYGPSGQGKTFFTIDTGAHIAAGQTWRGRRVKQALVVYVAAEAGVSITKRFVAWRDHHLSEAREGRTPLAILTRGVNLLDLTDVDGLVEELHELIAEAGIPLGAVIFDTLSRSTPGSEEGAADFGLAIQAADRLRDEFGAATVFVHHSGKDTAKGARGHSSLFAAADTVICVEGTAGATVSVCVAEVEKSRDGKTGEQFPFRLEVIDLGMDQDGEPVTTCIVHEIDTVPAAKTRARELPGVAKVALRALEEAVSEHGKTMPETSTIPGGVKAVRIDDWRNRFALRYGSDADGKRDSAAVRQAFRRGKDALLKVQAVGISDPYCWSTS